MRKRRRRVRHHARSHRRADEADREAAALTQQARQTRRHLRTLAAVVLIGLSITACSPSEIWWSLYLDSPHLQDATSQAARSVARLERDASEAACIQTAFPWLAYEDRHWPIHYGDLGRANNAEELEALLSTQNHYVVPDLQGTTVRFTLGFSTKFTVGSSSGRPLSNDLWFMDNYHPPTQDRSAMAVLCGEWASAAGNRCDLSATWANRWEDWKALVCRYEIDVMAEYDEAFYSLCPDNWNDCLTLTEEQEESIQQFLPTEKQLSEARYSHSHIALPWAPGRHMVEHIHSELGKDLLVPAWFSDSIEYHYDTDICYYYGYYPIPDGTPAAACAGYPSIWFRSADGGAPGAVVHEFGHMIHQYVDIHLKPVDYGDWRTLCNEVGTKSTAIPDGGESPVAFVYACMNTSEYFAVAFENYMAGIDEKLPNEARQMIEDALQQIREHTPADAHRP